MMDEFNVGLEQLAELFDRWGMVDERSAEAVNSLDMKRVLRAKCEVWHEAARYLRKVVDESRPLPDDFDDMNPDEEWGVTNAWPPAHYEHVDEAEIADRSIFQP